MSQTVDTHGSKLVLELFPPGPDIIGQTLLFTLRTTDVNGRPVAASGPTLHAKRPDGTIVDLDTVSFVQDGVNVWKANGMLDMIGRWQFNAQVEDPITAEALANINVIDGIPEGGSLWPGWVPVTKAPVFTTRADFATAVSGGLMPPESTVVSAGGLQYVRRAASAAISDLPGYDPVSPTLRHWGAAGDGATNDAAKITDAMWSGLPLNGEGRTYGVSGMLTLPAGLRLVDACFRQLAPAASTGVVTLFANAVDRLRLVRVSVDRNGDGSNGGLALPPNGLQSTCIAIRIDGGRYHHFEDLEVFGDDSGTGIRFNGLDATSTVIRPYAHDMMAQVLGATDDCVQGVVFQVCINLVIIEPKSARLSWRPDALTAPTYTNSRGLAYSGCENCSIYAISTEDSGQGNDMTGNLGNGNRNNRVFGGSVSRHETWGMKFANIASGNSAFGVVATDCKSAGFVDSASFDTSVSEAEANRYVDCRAINCGSTGGSSAAFLKLNGSRPFTNPVHFLDCVALELRTPAEMVFGFRSEVASRSNAIARARNCISVGHTSAAKSGFQDDLLNRVTVSGQAANGAPTYVTGSAILLPPQSVFSQGGVYRFRCRLTKSAAGVAAPKIQLRFGAADLTSVMLGEATLDAQTAVADEAELEITAVFRTTGASTTTANYLRLLTNLGTGGFATKQVQIRAISVAAFNCLVDGAMFGVAIDPGASAVWQIVGAHAKLEVLGTGT